MKKTVRILIVITLPIIIICLLFSQTELCYRLIGNKKVIDYTVENTKFSDIINSVIKEVKHNYNLSENAIVSNINIYVSKDGKIENNMYPILRFDIYDKNHLINCYENTGKVEIMRTKFKDEIPNMNIALDDFQYLINSIDLKDFISNNIDYYIINDLQYDNYKDINEVVYDIKFYSINNEGRYKEIDGKKVENFYGLRLKGMRYKEKTDSSSASEQLNEYILLRSV